MFYSATDEFREEDDEEEHEREVADFYALQRSRRQFGGSRLEESSEGDDDGSKASNLAERAGDGRDADERGTGGLGRGIKSSWRGHKSSGKIRDKPDLSVTETEERRLHRASSGDSSTSGKDRMVDIGLESTMRSVLDQDDPPDDLAIEMPVDEDPPSIQQFRKPPGNHQTQPQFMPLETEAAKQHGRPRPPESDSESLPPSVSYPSTEPPRYDAFWGNLYLISLPSFFASYILVYLHTAKPSLPMGDTVYTTLHGSFHLLAVDTLVAVIVSVCWLALLRSYVRPLVYTILVAVPVILIAFSLYPFISSFGGAWHGMSIQDRVMRWASTVPGLLAILWTYSVYQGRHSFGKAIGILEFSCRILTANPALLMIGFCSLAFVTLWTWLWMAMFTRVFLGGHLSNAKGLFIIDFSTWWLGVFFVFIYLWTLGVAAGIQRATTAATVSQWYFHRLAIPAPTSNQVVQAALSHSMTTSFGTISLSALLNLVIRLPLLVLPGRLIALAGMCTYTLLPSSITILTNPTTLTYSAIHSQPLVSSSRAVAQMSIITPKNPATAIRLGNRDGSFKTYSSVLPYNLALLLLHSTRLITSFALGFGAWVNTARKLIPDATASSSIRGSLYAYIVGLIAGAIGWAVLGAMEGVLTGVVDAVVVCWASEVRNGEVRYCREAGWLLGDDEMDSERAGSAEREGLMRR